MFRNKLSILLASALLAAACSQAPVEDNQLLEYIPSDASALICSDRLDSGLEILFSPEDVLRDLNLGKLAGEPAVISLHYSGQLIPMVAVAAGRPSEIAPSAISSLAGSADSLGLKSLYIPAEPKSGKKNVLLICESESILAAAQRHVDQDASILEVPGLSEALAQSRSAGQTIIFRNEAAGQLVDKDFMSRYVRRRDLLSFINNLSTWTVLRLEQSKVIGKGEYQTYRVQPVCDGGMDHYYNVLSSLQPAASQLGGMLPYGTTYAADLPMASVADFVAVRKQYLDATGSLNRFNMFCKSHKTAEGWDPVRWAEEIEIREVARLWCRGEEVLLIRAGKTPRVEGIAEYAYAGFTSAVFGREFGTANEKYCANVGDWLVVGSEKAVRHYVQSSRKHARKDWSVKSTRAAVFADDMLVSCEDGGIKIDVYKTY